MEEMTKEFLCAVALSEKQVFKTSIAWYDPCCPIYLNHTLIICMCLPCYR
jgi:hypothetical protein